MEKIEFFLPMIPPTVEWKKIPGFGDKYSVSNDGSIKNDCTGKILKNKVMHDGYLRVHLSNQNHAAYFMVHRLVAEAFIPNPDNLPVVNHIDGNKSNPSVNNLEWVTFSDNSKHAYRTGLAHISEKCKQAAGRVAAENGAKTTRKAVCKINADGEKTIYRGVREAEKANGIPRQNIIRACKNNKYTAGGYKWEYV